MSLLDLRKLSVPVLSAAVLLTLVHGCGDDGGTAGGGGSPDPTTASGVGPTTSTGAAPTTGTTSAGPTTTSGSSSSNASSSNASSSSAAASTTTATSAASSSSSGMCLPVGIETCATPADEDCDGTECALWGHVYDGTESHGSDMAVAPNGDIYMIGEIGATGATIDFDGTIVTASATSQWFLTKISAQGATVWTKRLPLVTDPQYSQYTLVGATNTNVVIDAFFTQPADFGGGVLQPSGWYDRAFVAYGADGSFQWSTSFVTPADGPLWATPGISPLGEVVVVGHAVDGTTYDGTVITDANVGVDERNWFGLALDAATGSLLWHDDGWQVGSENNNTYQALAFGPSGDIYITGSVSTDLTFDGHTLTFANDYTSAYVAHLDPDGGWVGGAMFGDNVYPETMTIGPNGEIVLGAWVDFFEFFGAFTPSEPNRYAVFALDATWEPSWVHFMSEVPTLATAPDGDIAFLLGDNFDIAIDAPATFPAIGTIDIVTGRIGLDGTIKWYRQFGAPGALVDDHSPRATFGIQPDGKSIIAFRAAGNPVDFGSGPLQATGTDKAIVQLAP